jgi:hypothetical protein
LIETTTLFHSSYIFSLSSSFFFLSFIPFLRQRFYIFHKHLFSLQHTPSFLISVSTKIPFSLFIFYCHYHGFIWYFTFCYQKPSILCFTTRFFQSWFVFRGLRGLCWKLNLVFTVYFPLSLFVYKKNPFFIFFLNYIFDPV